MDGWGGGGGFVVLGSRMVLAMMIAMMNF